MIKVICRTNLDDYTCPVKFMVGIPNKGDFVEVRKNGNLTSLKIIQITHRVNVHDEPYIEIELHNLNG